MEDGTLKTVVMEAGVMLLDEVDFVTSVWWMIKAVASRLVAIDKQLNPIDSRCFRRVDERNASSTAGTAIGKQQSDKAMADSGFENRRNLLLLMFR